MPTYYNLPAFTPKQKEEPKQEPLVNDNIAQLLDAYNMSKNPMQSPADGYISPNTEPQIRDILNQNQPEVPQIEQLATEQAPEMALPEEQSLNELTQPKIEDFSPSANEKDLRILNNASPRTNDAEIQRLKDLMSKYSEFNKSSKEKLSQAQESDRNTELFNNLNQAFNQANSALANRAGNTSIKTEGLKLNPRSQKDLETLLGVDKDQLGVESKFGEELSKAQNPVGQIKQLGDALYEVQPDGTVKPLVLGSKQLAKNSAEKPQYRVIDGQLVQVNAPEGPKVIFGDIANKDLKQKNLELRQKKVDLQEQQQNMQVLNKYVKPVSELDDALTMLKDIEDNKPKFDTGPLASKKNLAAQTLGIDDPEYSAFRAKVGSSLADYIKSISGAAVSDQERAFLLKNLPSMDDNDKTFVAKIKVVKERLQRNRDNLLNNVEKTGVDLNKFKKEIKNPFSNSSVKTVKLRSPDGQVVSVPAEKAQKYLDKGATLVEE